MTSLLTHLTAEIGLSRNHVSNKSNIPEKLQQSAEGMSSEQTLPVMNIINLFEGPIEVESTMSGETKVEGYNGSLRSSLKWLRRWKSTSSTLGSKESNILDEGHAIFSYRILYPDIPPPPPTSKPISYQHAEGDYFTLTASITEEHDPSHPHHPSWHTLPYTPTSPHKPNPKAISVSVYTIQLPSISHGEFSLHWLPSPRSILLNQHKLRICWSPPERPILRERVRGAMVIKTISENPVGFDVVRSGKVKADVAGILAGESKEKGSWVFKWYPETVPEGMTLREVKWPKEGEEKRCEEVVVELGRVPAHIVRFLEMEESVDEKNLVIRWKRTRAFEVEVPQYICKRRRGKGKGLMRDYMVGEKEYDYERRVLRWILVRRRGREKEMGNARGGWQRRD